MEVRIQDLHDIMVPLSGQQHGSRSGHQSHARGPIKAMHVYL